MKILHPEDYKRKDEYQLDLLQRKALLFVCPIWQKKIVRLADRDIFCHKLIKVEPELLYQTLSGKKFPSFQGHF